MQPTTGEEEAVGEQGEPSLTTLNAAIPMGPSVERSESVSQSQTGTTLVEEAQTSVIDSAAWIEMNFIVETFNPLLSKLRDDIHSLQDRIEVVISTVAGCEIHSPLAYELERQCRELDTIVDSIPEGFEMRGICKLEDVLLLLQGQVRELSNVFKTAIEIFNRLATELTALEEEF